MRFLQIFYKKFPILSKKIHWFLDAIIYGIIEQRLKTKSLMK